ncbi:MAG: hypothetical protein ABSD42_02095 [Candidatus Bathyarchaeia archaeon]|jgi:hypothetical protein
MKDNGLTEGTLKSINYRIKQLDKNTDLMKPKEVKAFIAQMKQANSYKQCMIKACNYFADVNGSVRYISKRKWSCVQTTKFDLGSRN